MAVLVKRKTLSTTTRFAVLSRDGFSCRYCGRGTDEAVLEVDHLLPVSRGGTDDIDNLATSCRECNRGKNVERTEPYLLPVSVEALLCQITTPMATVFSWNETVGDDEDKARYLLIDAYKCLGVLDFLASAYTSRQFDTGVEYGLKFLQTDGLRQTVDAAADLFRHGYYDESFLHSSKAFEDMVEFIDLLPTRLGECFY